MAKKKYYQSGQSRMAESRGMERYETKKMMRNKENSNYRNHNMMYDEYYAGMDPRRRQELEDSMMIREDHHEIANLPQHVVMREYPKIGYGGHYHLDDTIRGIDNQIDDDVDEMKREMYPEKY